MAVNKNFVVKNGLEVKTNLLIADGLSDKVGIGTSIVNYKFHVNGGIGATDIYVSGGSTITSLSGSDVTYTTGNLTTLNASQGYIITGVVTTLSGSTLDYTGISTVGSLYVGSNQVISSGRQLQNITSLDSTTTATIESAIANGPNTFADLVVTGISTLGVTSATELRSQNFNVSGVGTITNLNGINLNYTGVATIGTLNATNATISGASFTISNNLYVGGIGTISTGIITTLRGTNLNYTGISTLTNLGGTNLNYSGIGTIGRIVINSGIITATSGIITYYGDGSKLQNIVSGVSGVGIRTSGGTVGLGATILDFRGSGISEITVSSGIATINIVDTGSVGDLNNINASGIITASRFVSTISSGTAPFVVLSDTQVTNLNASFLRGKIPPSGEIVGTTDSQTLSSKLLTSPILTNPIVSSVGIGVSGSTSGTTTIRASDVASGIVTVPSTNDILIARNTTDTLTNKTISAASNTITNLTNTNLSGSAGITNANLANSTISGVSLGGNLFNLTAGSYITYDSGTTYNGSTAKTIAVNASTTNTANTIIARDASGDFTAGSITASNFNATSTIKISNTTVIDNNRNLINVVGGSFSGIVTCSDLNSNSTIKISNTTVIDSNRNLINVVGGNFSGIVTCSDLNSNSTIKIGGTNVIDSGRNLINVVGGNFSGIVTSNTLNATSSIQLNSTNVIDSGRNLINVVGGNFSGIVTCSDLNSTSDINLKENVQTFERALETIDQLRGVSFNWKENGKSSIGVIAQEIEKVLPQLVSDTEIKTVNYNGIIGVLIEAVKELSSEVEKLKKRVI